LARSSLYVWFPDTDALTLLELVARNHIAAEKVLTGKGTKYREIDVIERVQATGHRKCQASLESTTSLELTGVENLWASQRSPGLMNRPTLNSTTKILP